VVEIRRLENIVLPGRMISLRHLPDSQPARF
jgi:hypothetical protein